MIVYEVEATDYYGEYTADLGLFDSKKKAYKALFENGFAIDKLHGRPAWMNNHLGGYADMLMVARIYERTVR